MEIIIILVSFISYESKISTFHKEKDNILSSLTSITNKITEYRFETMKFSVNVSQQMQSKIKQIINYNTICTNKIVFYYFKCDHSNQSLYLPQKVQSIRFSTETSLVVEFGRMILKYDHICYTILQRYVTQTIKWLLFYIIKVIQVTQ